MERKDAFSLYGGLFYGEGCNGGTSALGSRDKIKVAALLDCSDDRLARLVKSPLSGYRQQH